MCGISGIINLNRSPIPHLDRKLSVMSVLLQHRGPDGDGVWIHPESHAGFAHRRLSVIDIEGGTQPMTLVPDLIIVHNGEIYNYRELKNELGPEDFQTRSDTEVILRSYLKWGEDCVQHFRGMFAFALWDEREQKLFCARDRFGIKPFCFTKIDSHFYFASEAKALLPFLPEIRTSPDALLDYITFQFLLDGKTLFQNIEELPPAHTLTVRNGQISVRRYWQVYYHLDWRHGAAHFEENVHHLFEDSVRMHLRSDVAVGSYVSGGMDSSLVSTIARQHHTADDFFGFNGRFDAGPSYDESSYAKILTKHCRFELFEKTITADDFVKNISDVIYHLDYPVAGPGSFAQYMVSGLASRHRKVLLGGQGGDEIFGGYTRYLIAYFEQCIKAAIDGTMHNGNFIVTYESIIPNLRSLKNYKPLLQEFWSSGLFEDLDRRYFRLIDKSGPLQNTVKPPASENYSPFESFQKLFHAENVQKESYFDSMTHFDFKTLLPALLHVEDRVSMAHGIESRVPFLDHPLVEFCATIPSNIKFQNGNMKHLLKKSMGNHLPSEILNRTDKMGFPVPLNIWAKSGLRDFLNDIFSSQRARERDYLDPKNLATCLDPKSEFGRGLWGLLSLELWHREFHDRAREFKFNGIEASSSVAHPAI